MLLHLNQLRSDKMISYFCTYRNGVTNVQDTDQRQETENANVRNHITEDFVNIKMIVKRIKIVITKV